MSGHSTHPSTEAFLPGNSNGGSGGPDLDHGLIAKVRKRLDQIVFSSLLVLIVLTIVPYGTVDAWWEALFEIAVFVLTALWIFEAVLQGRWHVNKLGVLLPLVIITVYMFAQTIQLPQSWVQSGAQRMLTIDRYQTLLTARKSLALTLFMGLLLLHTSMPGRLRWLIRVVIGIGVGSALFGILRQLLQSPDSTNGFVLPFLFPGMGYGQFISANVFAYLIEMVFGLMAGLVLGGGVRRNLVPLYLAAMLIMWTSLVLCNSRGGVISLTVQSMLVLFVSLNWYSRRRQFREDGWQNKWLTVVRSSTLIRVFFVIILVGTLVGGVIWMGGERLASKLEKSDSTQDVIDGTTRQEIWRSSWVLIKHHPWSGVGFGAYFLAIPEYLAGSGRLKVEQAHNDYLDLAANGGLVGVVLACWFVAGTLRRARSSLRTQDSFRRAACLGALAGMLGVAVHSFVDFGLQVTGIGVVFAALVVISVADRRVEVNPANRARERSGF